MKNGTFENINVKIRGPICTYSPCERNAYLQICRVGPPCSPGLTGDPVRVPQSWWGPHSTKCRFPARTIRNLTSMTSKQYRNKHLHKMSSFSCSWKKCRGLKIIPGREGEWRVLKEPVWLAPTVHCTKHAHEINTEALYIRNKSNQGRHGRQRNKKPPLHSRAELYHEWQEKHPHATWIGTDKTAYH